MIEYTIDFQLNITEVALTFTGTWLTRFLMLLKTSYRLRFIVGTI